MALVILAILYYALAGIALGLGLHRMLSHGSFKLPKWLAYPIITLSLPAGTPVQWCGNHRFHHAHTDTPKDPHSPLIHGFWYAHVGWYLGTANPIICVIYSLAGPFRIIFDSFWRPRTNQQYNHLSKDISRDPYYNWISRPLPYMIMMWSHLAVFFGLAHFIGGITGIITMWILLVFIYNISDATDSVAHMYGDKLVSQKSEARNHWIMGLITLGDGWHANHHTYPKSARHGLFKNQFDWTWYVICFLEKLGFAKDIHVTNIATTEKE